MQTVANSTSYKEQIEKILNAHNIRAEISVTLGRLFLLFTDDQHFKTFEEIITKLNSAEPTRNPIHCKYNLETKKISINNPGTALEYLLARTPCEKKNEVQVKDEPQRKSLGAKPNQTFEAKS